MDILADTPPLLLLAIAASTGQILCVWKISLAASQPLTMSLSCRHEV
jgi:hypothetical protein